MEPVRTDYDGAWIGALVPALLGGAPAPWLPAVALDADGVVLLVLDGLGWSALDAHADRLPELTAMTSVPATSVVPSTTAAALTSIATGLAPAAHGVVGYRMRVGGQILNILRWQVAGERNAPDPRRVQPTPPFLGRGVPVVTRAEFRETGFTGAHLRGATLLGWRTTAVLVEHVRRAVVGGARFVYAYYDGVDKVAHEYGLNDGFYAAELAAADALVGALRDTLPPEYALVVTADHGQVHVGPDAVVDLDSLDRYVSTYSGEGRFRSLHARPGASANLRAAARECFGEVAWVFARDELFDDGWLGAGATAETRGRVGDVILAARALTSFRDPGDPKESLLVGRHGSITPDEMLVPVAVARGRA
jgi:hypothetical protein